MERIVYKDIDLKIEPDGDRYEVSASSSCGGDATATFAADELDFDLALTDEPQETNERHLVPIADPNSDSLPLIKTRPPSLKKARVFGQLLFKVVFKDSVGRVLDRCLNRNKPKNDNTQLRIRLNLTKAPDLAGLPWEFLSLVTQNIFFAKSYDSLVRYLELGTPFDESLLQEPPLRILAVLSNPEGAPKLDVHGELKNLQDAIGQVDDGRRIILDPLYKPTIKALRKRLHEHRTSDPYHVFHFIGHGVFDSFTNEGKLLLENEAGGVSQISAQELGEILANHRSLRLAIINACEGARVSPKDSYSGVAQTLLRNEAVPAVIAMQYIISDGAAKTFAKSFYEELLKGSDVDTAVSWARMAISDTEQDQGRSNSVEWGTPVLYMRAKDSRLVDFLSVSKNEEMKVVPTTSRDDLMTSRDDPEDGHYQDVIKALLDGQLVPFLGLNVNLFDQHATPRPPAYDELVERLVKLSKYPYNPGLLAGVSQYAQLPNRLATLYDNLGPFFNDEKFKPTRLHKFWARIAREHILYPANIDPKRKRFLIVTTNYDSLLEQEFIKVVEDFHIFSYIAEGNDQERGKFVRKRYHDGAGGEPILVEFKNKELTDDLPVILKLPGTIEPFNSKIRFAITEDQYFDLLTNRELTSILPSQVMTKLRGSHHLFMGCTLSDWSLRGIFYRIWEKAWPSYDSWTIQKGLPQFERKYWEACQIKIIDVDLAEYITGLEQRLPQVKNTAPDTIT